MIIFIIYMIISVIITLWVSNRPDGNSMPIPIIILLLILAPILFICFIPAGIQAAKKSNNKKKGDDDNEKTN